MSAAGAILHNVPGSDPGVSLAITWVLAEHAAAGFGRIIMR